MIDESNSNITTKLPPTWTEKYAITLIVICLLAAMWLAYGLTYAAMDCGDEGAGKIIKAIDTFFSDNPELGGGLLLGGGEIGLIGIAFLIDKYRNNLITTNPINDNSKTKTYRFNEIGSLDSILSQLRDKGININCYNEDTETLPVSLPFFQNLPSANYYVESFTTKRNADDGPYVKFRNECGDQPIILIAIHHGRSFPKVWFELMGSEGNPPAQPPIGICQIPAYDFIKFDPTHEQLYTKNLTHAQTLLTAQSSNSVV